MFIPTSKEILSRLLETAGKFFPAFDGVRLLWHRIRTNSELTEFGARVV